LISDALKLAQVRGVRLCGPLIQWSGLVLMLSTTALGAQERRVSFDMPAQSLASALVEFADKTGMAALIDGELTRGLRSSPVKGRLSPPDALRILLAGTGLSIRYAGVSAFTVGLATPEQGRETGRSRNGHRADYGIYFSQVQSALERALCRSDSTRPGQYRAAFQIWVGDDGSVQALHLLGSTGDETRDATITDVLTKTSIALPPRDLPQPLTVILQPKAPDSGCAGLSGPRP
jgi:TonB C terminal